MTEFFCKRLETGVKLEDCADCAEYAECKTSGYFPGITAQHKKQTFSVPKAGDNGAFPNPKRVTEIQEAIKGSWPEKCSMPPCHLDQEDCWNCDKRLEGLKVSFLPCVRDIAHLAALYEAQRNTSKSASKRKDKAAGKEKVAEHRMLHNHEAMEKDFTDGLPRVACTYIKNAIETERIDAIVRRSKKGYALEKERLNEPDKSSTKESSRVGTRELASFIDSMDMLFEKENVPKDQFIMAAIGALEPIVPVSAEAIRTARFRFRHSKK